MYNSEVVYVSPLGNQFELPTLDQMLSLLTKGTDAFMLMHDSETREDARIRGVFNINNSKVTKDSIDRMMQDGFTGRDEVSQILHIDNHILFVVED